MCPALGSEGLHSTIGLAVGLTDIAAKVTSVDMIHREVLPTGLVVVVAGQVPQAREMLEEVVEAATLTLEGMVATRITVPMEVPAAVPHRVVLPLTPQVLGNCSPEAVVDPEGSMTQPASQGPLVMGAESFTLLQIQ
jgi:hypothetical protein